MNKPFINDDFMLYSDTARTLYHEAAEGMPIIDFHNHLNVQEIYEDKCYDNLAELWLGGDHYKWRVMRANGVAEKYVTGDAEPYEKFLAYAGTVQACLGNPIYHWTHLELARYFGVTETLSPDTAEEIWNEVNEKLKSPEYSVRNLLRMQGAEVLCTTDDPADTLEWHTKLREEGFEIKVIPSFRPGGALDIEKDGFAAYMKRLGEAAGMEIATRDDMLAALKDRLQFFVGNGCRVTDHSLESDFYYRYEDADEEEAALDAIFDKRMKGEAVTTEECAVWRGWLLVELGKEYARNDLVMQLHIGAIRNNSSRMFAKLGADTGFDSLNDFNYAPQLSAMFDEMDKTDELPKAILYCLNPKDQPMLAAMAGNYQSNEKGIRGKVQLGTAWWFCDHLHGMERQMDDLADTGLLSASVGMLTDSRSFLSFPRHEYYRRILCNKIGDTVEKGQYPADMEYLRKMVRNICHDNAKAYFGV